MTDQPKKKTDSELAQEFVEEYKQLCEKHGFSIQVTPEWKVSQDTGDWRLVLQSGVAKMAKEVK